MRQVDINVVALRRMTRFDFGGLGHCSNDPRKRNSTRISATCPVRDGRHWDWSPINMGHLFRQTD
jgi:hypothetical protein